MDEQSVDPFEGYSPLPGLEHLGRHITDPSGMPSGSPANFEALRGASYPEGYPVAGQAVVDAEAIIAALRKEFGPADPDPDAESGGLSKSE